MISSYYEFIIITVILLSCGVSAEKYNYSTLYQEYQEYEVTPRAAVAYSEGLKYFYGNATINRDLRQALQFFREAADLGHSGAQFTLALFYTNGLVVPKNEGLAVLYLTFSALGEDIDALMSLGFRNMFGHGVAKSCTDASRHYRKAADAVARSQFDSGVLPVVEKIRLNDDAVLQRRQTEEDVMQYYKYSADKGNVQSQMLLGRAFMVGARGIPQDAALAERYFQMAVQNGDPGGYGGLGTLYVQGVDQGKTTLQRNYTKALHYFKLGAEHNNVVSLNGLGFLYLGGYDDGTTQNYSEAARYFQLAADQNNAEAQYNIGLLYLRGEGVPKDYEKAMKYLQVSSAQGQVLAHYQLGNVYADGLANQIPNCELAVRFYRAVAEKGPWSRRIEDAFDKYLEGDYTTSLLQYLIVAEQGYEIGQGNAAHMLDQQYGLDEIPRELIFQINNDVPTATVPTNETVPSEFQMKRNMRDIYRERAFVWYQRSALQGNMDSLLKLGDYYYYGWGVPVNHAESIEQYREAAQRGHPQAMFNLGYMHEHGLSVAKDFHLAKRCYDQAAALSEKAWVPAQLALLKLEVHRVLDSLLWARGRRKAELRATQAQISDTAARRASSAQLRES